MEKLVCSIEVPSAGERPDWDKLYLHIEENFLSPLQAQVKARNLGYLRWGGPSDGSTRLTIAFHAFLESPDHRSGDYLGFVKDIDKVWLTRQGNSSIKTLTLKKFMAHLAGFLRTKLEENRQATPR